MPYALRKAPKHIYGNDAYWVVTVATGKHHSEKPLPKKRAEAQLRVLNATLR
jgi:hypothetical protein